MNRKILFTFVAVLAGGLAGCSSGGRPVPPAPPVVRDLALEAVQPVTVPDWGETVGTVRAVETAQLASQIVANVREVRVREGARVHHGETLIVLDNAQPEAAMQSAQARLNAAEQGVAAAESDATLAASTLKRYQGLYEKKSVSPHEMDQVEAQAKAAVARRDMSLAERAQAQAMLAEARTAEGYTRIRAPFDGVVTARYVDPGALATAGTPLLTIEDTRRFRLEVTVDESQIGDVKLGESAPVQLDAFSGETMTGKVVQIVPAADPASRSFLVKLELPTEGRLRSGLFGRARFAHGTRKALMLSKTAVIDRGQLQAVYVAGQNNVLDLRYVTLGKPEAQRVEILSGLQPGERVVTAPGDQELAGKRVENVRQ